MLTKNDRLFCLLVSCDGTIEARRLTHYMYTFQHMGIDLSYKFKITGDGISSESFNDYLNDVIFDNILGYNEQLRLDCFSDLDEWFSRYPLTAQELRIMTTTIKLLDSLPFEFLDLMCISDFLINDIRVKQGDMALAEQRKTVETILKTLCPAYSKKNFNECLKHMRELKELYETIQ